jgi:Ni2+-binding GTPase involved in maturation of urease and hydrogenase
MVGGFLGAGKTTLVSRVVAKLSTEGVHCGVVMNDQARGLVDTRLMERSGAESVAEVAGGCFCCRLDDLVRLLTAELGRGGAGPLVVVAEPVGSCTDLMATVVLPLERVYRMPFRVSPLNVVVDGRRALASLGGRRTPGTFSKDVGYIYRKQLEEAEIVVVNKIDKMDAGDRADLLVRLEREYPAKEVFELSARADEGVDSWLRRVLDGESAPQGLMEIDYGLYGIGEALLGWVNAEVEIDGRDDLDGDLWLLELARGIAAGLQETECEVAHFKMALSNGTGQLGVVNLTMSGTSPELSRKIGGGLGHGTLTVNLRAEGEPATLRSIIETEVEKHARQAAIRCRFGEVAAFRPGQPVATAKVTEL